MSKRFVLLGLAITGCGTQSGAATFLANIDASAAPSTVFVEVYFASGAPGSMPIATPGILAGTAPPATTAMIWAGRSMSAGYHGQPIGFFPGGELGHPMYVGAIGLTETGISGGAWSGRSTIPRMPWWS